jgi:hypothetical protein
LTEVILQKLILAVGFAALTTACVPAGNPLYTQPAVAVVSPDYSHGYGFYRPWGYGYSVRYRPYFPRYAHRHHEYRGHPHSAYRRGYRHAGADAKSAMSGVA